jgi:hypothetical protein
MEEEKKTVTLITPSEKSEQKPNKLSVNRVLLKVKYSFYSMLVFFIFANPETFLLTQGAFGSILTIAQPSGVPTPVGFFLHAGLFFCTMLGLMLLPSE